MAFNWDNLMFAWTKTHINTQFKSDLNKIKLDILIVIHCFYNKKQV